MRPVLRPAQLYKHVSGPHCALPGPGRRMLVGSKPSHCRRTDRRRRRRRRRAARVGEPRVYVRIYTFACVARNAPCGNARRAFVVPRAKSCSSSSCLFCVPSVPLSSCVIHPLSSFCSYERGCCRRETPAARSHDGRVSPSSLSWREGKGSKREAEIFRREMKFL